MLPNKPQAAVPPDFQQFGVDYEDHEDHLKDFNQNEEMQGMITTELVIRHMGQKNLFFLSTYVYQPNLQFKISGILLEFYFHLV